MGDKRAGVHARGGALHVADVGVHALDSDRDRGGGADRRRLAPAGFRPRGSAVGFARDHRRRHILDDRIVERGQTGRFQIERDVFPVKGEILLAVDGDAVVQADDDGGPDFSTVCEMAERPDALL